MLLEGTGIGQFRLGIKRAFRELFHGLFEEGEALLAVSSALFDLRQEKQGLRGDGVVTCFFCNGKQDAARLIQVAGLNRFFSTRQFGGRCRFQGATDVLVFEPARGAVHAEGNDYHQADAQDNFGQTDIVFTFPKTHALPYIPYLPYVLSCRALARAYIRQAPLRQMRDDETRDRSSNISVTD